MYASIHCPEEKDVDRRTAIQMKLLWRPFHRLKAKQRCTSGDTPSKKDVLFASIEILGKRGTRESFIISALLMSTDMALGKTQFLTDRKPRRRPFVVHTPSSTLMSEILCTLEGVPSMSHWVIPLTAAVGIVLLPFRSQFQTNSNVCHADVGGRCSTGSFVAFVSIVSTSS